MFYFQWCKCLREIDCNNSCNRKWKKSKRQGLDRSKNSERKTSRSRSRSENGRFDSTSIENDRRQSKTIDQPSNWYVFCRKYPFELFKTIFCPISHEYRIFWEKTLFLRKWPISIKGCSDPGHLFLKSMSERVGSGIQRLWNLFQNRLEMTTSTWRHRNSES